MTVIDDFKGWNDITVDHVGENDVTSCSGFWDLSPGIGIGLSLFVEYEHLVTVARDIFSNGRSN